MSSGKKKRGPIGFLFEYSLFLVLGAVGALAWANLDAKSYHRFVHFDLTKIVREDSRHHDGDHDDAHIHDDDHSSEEHGASGTDHDSHNELADSTAAHDDAPHDDDANNEAAHDDERNHASAAEAGGSSLAAATSAKSDSAHKDGEKADAEHASHGLTIHFLINDILMALFFAIAGKEVWESMLPGGALSNPRKAATPLLATLGGVVGPALLYIAGAMILGRSGWFGQEGVLGRGWAVPCATDIAFSYLVARLIFGNGHPAIAFLLLLAIADDAAGLVILAIAYPQGAIQPLWFLLTAAAIGLCFVFRKMRIHSFWFYLLIPGVMSWFSFYFAGIHAALGLIPIIPALPHAHTDLGLFAKNELHRDDTLNEFEHWWKNPVEIILGLFGLANAGVAFSSVGAGTSLVLIGLIVGKPLGITALTWIAEKIFRLEIPAGMGYRHIITLGTVAGIGFTVALFVSEAAFPSSNPAFDHVRDSVKMGALGSFFAGALAIGVGRALGIRPLGDGGSSESHSDDSTVSRSEGHETHAVSHAATPAASQA